MLLYDCTVVLKDFSGMLCIVHYFRNGMYLVVFDDHCVSFSSRLAYFAVFDGHGGSRASRFAAENLHRTLAQKFPKSEYSLRSSVQTFCTRGSSWSSH